MRRAPAPHAAARHAPLRRRPRRLARDPAGRDRRYFGFTKAVPFPHHFEIQAVVKTANMLRPRSPVRIAGVNVGKVTKVERYERHQRRRRHDADQRQGPADPRGRDAEDPAAPVPRGQLLRRPPARARRRAGELDDGGMIPVTQTGTPVQLDQVLTALQSDTRAGPAGRCSRARRRVQREAERGRGRRAGPAVRGVSGGAGPQRRARRRGPTRCAAPRRSTRRCSAPSPHDLSG